MEKAKTKLDVSTIAENRVVDKKVRDSETAWLDFTDPVVMRVARRCASLTDRPIMNCEHLQVLRYKPGGHYRPHQDTFSDTKGNKRMYTVILALNDDYEEGVSLGSDAGARARDIIIPMIELDNMSF